MSSIDQRVVEMKFSNKQFESGVSSTMSALDKLKSALKFGDVKDGFADLQKSSKGFSLDHIGQSVDAIKGKFSALSIAGVAALSAIAVSAVNFGKNQIGKMFGGFTDGFAEYELKMGSIQTIMAGTGASLQEVNGHLDALNAYSDRTIYSFADMTESIGKFTNAGVELPEAVDAIKGISNAAALAGADAGKASIAMYNFAQSMSTGFVNLQDWKSIELAGMATTGFKQELINTAEAAGTLTKVGDGLWKTMEGTEVTAEKFNYTLADQWATADVLTDTLSRYSDESTDLGKSAYAAAQDIKTFSQMMDTVQEAVGSGWAKSFEILIGDFEEAKTLFSSVGAALTGIVEKQADNRNKIFQDFVDLGGRDDIINGFKNLVAAVQGFIKPISDAWRAVFGPKNTESVSLIAKVLTAITGGFLKFTEVVKMGASAFGIVTNIFKILFSVLKGAGFILGAIAKGLFAVLSVVGNLAVGLIRFIGAMASMGVAFGSWLVQTEEAQRIFRALREIWDAITDTVRHFGQIIGEVGLHLSNALVNLRHGFNDQAVLAFQAALATLGVSTERAAKWANWLVSAFQDLKAAGKNLFDRLPLDSFADALEGASKAFGDLREKLSNRKGINTGSLDGVRDKMAGISTAASNTASAFQWVWEAFKWVGRQIKTVAIWLGPIIMSIADFVGTMVGKAKEYLEGLSFAEILALVNTGFFIMMYRSISGFFNNLNSIGEGFGESLEGIGDALKKFGKHETIATKILKIAIAIGILAAAAYVLTTVDTVKLIIALGAIAAMLGMLAITMKLMSKIEFKNDAKVIKAGIALAIMAVAILILASAAKKISGMDWNALAKGLVGVSVLLAGLALFTKFANLGGNDLIKGAFALVILSGAILLLSIAVEKFGEMDNGTLAKGLGTVALLLGGLMLMTKVMDGAKLTSAAFGLLILSAALLALSFSLEFYSKLDWDMLIDGLKKMAVTLIAVGIAARTLPGNLPVTALGLILVAGALMLLVPALEKMGSLPIPVLIQGLIALAYGLGIIAAAMWVMSAPGTLTGAAALGLVVAALYLLLPIIITLGTLPWEVVALGLGALAVGLGLVVAAGALAGMVVPGLAALALTILAIAIAIGIAGAGLALFALGFAALITAFVAGIAMLWTAFQGVIMMLPLVVQQIGLAVVALAVVIRDVGPQVVAAIGVVISSIIAEIVRLTPEVVAMVVTFVLAMALAVEATAPQLAASAMRMMLAILQEIRNYVPQITAEFLALVLTMLQTFRAHVPQIVNEAMLLMLEILAQLRTYIPQIVDEAMRMMTEFLAAVADNIGPIVDEATRLMVEFMDGIERNIPELVESGERMVRTFIREVGAALLGGVDDLIEDGAEMAAGIISGLTSGLRNGVNAVIGAAQEVASNALNGALEFLGIRSPSRKFMEVGRYSSEGLAVGLSNYAPVVSKAAEGVGHDAIFAMKKTLSGLPTAIDDNIDFNPTIRPVLDLTDLETAARRIDPLLSTTLSPTTSNRSANSAEIGYLENRMAELKQQEAQIEHVKEIKFEQNIHSPRALSRTEIYRQTKNQLSLLREV